MEKIISTVRIRPVSSQEKAMPSNPVCITQLNSKTVQALKNGSTTAADNFVYDHVFGGDSLNSDVYDHLLAPLLVRALEGYNVCVFTYGQTSSGKTHTMKGGPKDPGLIPLLLTNLFNQLTTQTTTTPQVQLEYVEIYNETVNDLLCRGNKDLEIRGDPAKGVVIKGITSKVVHGASEALELFAKGESERRFAETKMNHTSSRSHCVFRVHVVLEKMVADPDNPKVERKIKTTSAINLIDLAGSEGVAKTDADGERLK